MLTDTQAAGTDAGKLILQKDVTGLQSFSYGKMGELTENIRTFVVPNAGQLTFAMNFEYDTWNRTKSITYPDGEVVSYAYDNGGQLLSMEGNKNSTAYPYIDEILYDKFGSRISILYKNDIQTIYTYEPERRRLHELKSTDLSIPEIIQHVAFTYDANDNIINVVKSADRCVITESYDIETEYGYDDMSRLTSSGSVINIGNDSYDYEYAIGYTLSGNIDEKSVTGNILTLQGPEQISYSNVYEYGSQPHAISTINNGHKNFEWDANGNMLQWEDLDISRNRFQHWDEENRLTTVYDEDLYLSAYLYDASGERTLKLIIDIRK